MAISAAEQLLIELINRARLDPLAEAARLGLDLNAGLAPGTLNGTTKQVLAPNPILELAAEGHSQWMLANDVFSHTGAGGSSPHARMIAAGYSFTGSWTSGENISWTGTTAASLDLTGSILQQHDSLFRSAGHRKNILNGSYQELGVAQVLGSFTSQQSGVTYRSTSMLTENFARTGNSAFVTGVSYTDLDSDGFYSVGEAVAGLAISAPGAAAGAGATVLSQSAGGYSLQLAANSGLVPLQITGGPVTLQLAVQVGGRNIKLDVVDATTVLVSGDAVLQSGVRAARLLGLDDLNLTGGAADESLTGNSGANVLAGGAGNDDIRGGGGADTIRGEAGKNRLYGEDGSDLILAGDDGDLIGGGSGADILRGGAGADTLYGGVGDDNIGGGAGNDTIIDVIGANVIWAGLGDDTVQGGSGSDTIYGGGGTNDLSGNDGGDLIWASAAGDLMRGGAGNDSLFGAEGNDTILLGDGDDFTGGGAGNDLIRAEAGTNRIYGGLGDDRIEAGTGRDVMTGGPGADVFVFAGSDQIGIRGTRDVITDFTPGTDLIDLSALATRFNGTAGLLGGGQASFYLFAAAGLLIGDQQGDGLADWVLDLQGIAALSASDFLL